MRRLLTFSFFLFTFSLLLTGCPKKENRNSTTLTLSVSPSSVNVGLGEAQTFTSSAKRGDNTEDVTPTWALSSSSLGTLDKTEGTSVTFTASSDTSVLSSTGTLTASASGVSVDAQIKLVAPGTGTKPGGGNNSVTTAGYGIYSETTATGLSLDVDSKLGRYDDVDNATRVTLDTDTSDYYEGTKSLKATVRVNGGEWAGWYVQSGTAVYTFVGATDGCASVKNMNAYSGGTLKFLVKTPVDLIFSIRDCNTDPDTAPNVTLSSRGVIANNTWQEVSVSLATFGSDLTQMRTLFNIASSDDSGGTGGASKTFRVDNVRWVAP